MIKPYTLIVTLGFCLSSVLALAKTKQWPKVLSENDLE
jgi:hypothetical protein